MKKTFITPKAEIKVMQSAEMICASGITINENGGSGALNNESAGTGSAFAKHGSILHAQDILLDI